MSRRRVLGCCLFVGLLLVLAGGVAVGGVLADDPADSTGGQDTGDVQIAEPLENPQGEVEVLVGFDETDVAVANQDSIGGMQARADRAQADLVGFAAGTEGVTVERQFWIANAALVTVDTNHTSMAAIAAVEGVERVEENAQVRATSGTASDDTTGTSTANATGTAFENTTGGPQPASTTNASGPTSQASPDAPGATYGLEQIRATEAWDQFDTRGAGTSVAVLDSGVEASHPDIDLAGWAEFDGEGNQLDTEPRDYDPDNHGTHTSGTVAGGAASGQHIGVAPETALYHGAVLTDCSQSQCGGTTAQVLAGIEWAVSQDVDVISMSLGASGYRASQVDAVRNAIGAGTAVVASSGNNGKRTSGSPGNIYDTIAVGASNTERNIASFSGGERVDTEQAWGSFAPAAWPDRYVVPTVAAPGVNVRSAVAPDAYGQKSGTSMAAPHVAGAVALMQAATETEHSPAELEGALETTATKPANWSAAEAVRDPRYGTGIVDVVAAIEALSPPTATFRVSPSRPAATEPTTLDATGAVGNLTAYEWDLDGDGATDATGETVTTPLGATGGHEITLTVTTADNRTDTKTQVVPVRKQWVFEADGGVASSPTVADVPNASGSVGNTTRTAFVGDGAGTVHAVDVATGQERWAVDVESGVDTAPAYAELSLGGSEDNGTVFVTAGATVFALDAGSGAEYWQYEGEGTRLTGTTVADGTVYVGGTGGNIAALEAASGDRRWRFEGAGSVASPPAVTDVSVDGGPDHRTVFVGSGERLFALNASNGSRYWSNDAVSAVAGSPTVADVPAGTGPADGETVFVGVASGAVLAFDAATGDRQWATGTGFGIESSPTVGRDRGTETANQTVYVGGTDGRVYALNASAGDQRWAFNTGDWVDSSPTLVNGTVVVGSGDDFVTSSTSVYALDGATGEREWRFETGGAVRSSPTVVAGTESANGTVVVGSDDGSLYALDAGVAGGSDGSRVRLGTLGHHGEWADQSPTAVFSMNPVRPDEPFDLLPGESVTFDAGPTTGEVGTYEWEITDGAGTSVLDDPNPTGVTLNTTLDAGRYDVTLSVTTVDGEQTERTRSLLVTDPTTDNHWSVDLGGAVGSSPTIVDGPGTAKTAFVGSDNGTVAAVNATTGERNWTAEIGETVTSSPTVVGGMVFVGSSDGAIYALDADTGDDVWQYETGHPVRASPTVANATVYAGSDNGTLLALDAATGEREWRYNTGRVVRSSPTVVSGETGTESANGTVLVGRESGAVSAFDVATGEQRWSEDLSGAVVSSPTVATVADGNGSTERRVFVGSRDGRVHALDVATGERRWSHETGGPVWSSPTVASVRRADTENTTASGTAATVYVGSSDDNLYALDATTGDRAWAFETGGSVRSSPTVAGATGAPGDSAGTATASAGATVAVGSIDGTVYGLNASTGTFRWRLATGGRVESSPTIANVSLDGNGTGQTAAPTLFVGSGDGHLYASAAETAGPSFDSRVRSGVLGHHGAWADQPPVARVAVDPSIPEPGASVTLDAAESFGDIATYEWDLDGNGTVDATGETVTHTFPETANYPVSLTVTDERGDNATASHTVLVRATPPPVVGDDPPRDRTGDGLYEDVMGDGDLTVFDVQALFTNLDSDVVQDNALLFDFSGESPDSVTIFDVQALFARVGDVG